MPRRKAAAAEAAEANESAGPSDAVEPRAERASRSRRAPVRFESSQHTIARRGTKRQRAAASPTVSLAEKMEECAREESFVANYTYDHVGRAARDADATIWVDIPPLRSSKVSDIHLPDSLRVEDCSSGCCRHCQIATEAVKGARMGLIQVKNQHDHVVEKPDAPGPLITLDHQLPTQDSASVGAHLQRSQEALVDSNFNRVEGSDFDFEARGDIQNKKEPLLPAQTQLLSKVSTAHSASPDMSVDAAQNIIQPSNVAGSSKSALHAYHPEMRLSHENDERSVRRAVPADSTSPPLSARKWQTEAAPELLFFGEDEDRDDNDEVLAAPAGPSRLSGTPSATKKKAPADRVNKEPSARKLLPTVHSPNKIMAGSRSSQKHQKSKRVEKEKEGEKPKKAEHEQRARGADEERKKARKVVRRRVEDVHEGSQSDDDLTQSLNVDSFVNSTSNKEREMKRRENLMRLQRRQAKALKRRQGIESGSSEPSESDSGSTTTSSSDEDDDGVESFVVSDDESSRKKAEKKSQTVSSRNPSAVKHRRPPSPPPLSESRLQAYVQSLDSRMRFREYVRWLVLYALDVETEEQDRKRLEAVRAKLRDDFTMLYRSLTTSSNRRQFTWYLKHFPHFERRPMSAEEKAKHVGCHACHRKSQRCEYAFTCWGALYHLTTLTKFSKSEHTSSDMSEDSEDHKLISKNEKKEKVFTFFLGESCATKASVKHKLYHWERRVLSDVTKLPAFKALRRMQPEDIVAEEIEDIVGSYYLKLSRRFNVLKGHTEKLATENFSSYSKIRDRWDED